MTLAYKETMFRAEPAAAKRAYTIEEFRTRFGLGRTKIYEELKQGRLKAVRIGSKRLIRDDDAEAWLASLTDSRNQNAY